MEFTDKLVAFSGLDFIDRVIFALFIAPLLSETEFIWFSFSGLLDTFADPLRVFGALLLIVLGVDELLLERDALLLVFDAVTLGCCSRNCEALSGASRPLGFL